MNYSKLSLEELLKINDGNGDLYEAIGRKYFEVKSYDLAITYLKKSLTYYEHPDSLALLSHMYYSSYNKEITISESNPRKCMLEYMDRYVKVCWNKITYEFDLWNGLFGFDRDYTKNKDDAIFFRYLFLGCIDKPKEIKDYISALEILSDNGYCNASFYLGRCYEDNEYIERNVEKSIKYYTEAHKFGMNHATGRLAVLYEEKGETEKAYKFAFDSATNHRGNKYKYTMSKELLEEMKKDKNCCYGPMLFLAEIFSGDYSNLSYKVKVDLKMAKELYSLSDEYSEGVHKKYYALFAVTHPEYVSDKELKALIKDCYEDLPFAYACERALGFGLKKEADVIFKNALEWEEYYIISDLLEAFPDRKDEIEPVLKQFKKTKIVYPSYYPRITKHREEIRMKEEKAAEEKKLKEELERKIRKEAEEKKEKELEIKRAEEKKKSEDEYAKILAMIREHKIKETVSLMERNKSYLARKFPVVYYVMKCLNKEECPRFEISSYNTLYRKDTTNDVDKEYINKIIFNSVNVKRYIDEGLKELNFKQVKEISGLKNTMKYYDCLRDIRNLVVIYVDENFSVEEKRKYCLGLALLDNVMFDLNVYASWCEKDKREIIYKIGDVYGSWDCRYNLWALEYKRLGLFKKVEKQKVIDKMKRIASFNDPAYLWLKKHKVEVAERTINNVRLEYLKRCKDYYIDLGV